MGDNYRVEEAEIEENESTKSNTYFPNINFDKNDYVDNIKNYVFFINSRLSKKINLTYINSNIIYFTFIAKINIRKEIIKLIKKSEINKEIGIKYIQLLKLYITLEQFTKHLDYSIQNIGTSSEVPKKYYKFLDNISNIFDITDININIKEEENEVIYLPLTSCYEYPECLEDFLLKPQSKTITEIELEKDLIDLNDKFLQTFKNLSFNKIYTNNNIINLNKKDIINYTLTKINDDDKESNLTHLLSIRFKNNISDKPTLDKTDSDKTYALFMKNNRVNINKIYKYQNIIDTISESNIKYILYLGKAEYSKEDNRLKFEISNYIYIYIYNEVPANAIKYAEIKKIFTYEILYYLYNIEYITSTIKNIDEILSSTDVKQAWCEKKTTQNLNDDDNTFFEKYMDTITIDNKTKYNYEIPENTIILLKNNCNEIQNNNITSLNVVSIYGLSLTFDKLYLSNNIKILDNIKYLSTLTKISYEAIYDKSHLLSIRLNHGNDINILNFCKNYKGNINKYIFVKDNCRSDFNNNIYKIKEQEQEGQEKQEEEQEKQEEEQEEQEGQGQGQEGQGQGQEGQGQEEQGNIKYILYLGKATYKEKEKEEEINFKIDSVIFIVKTINYSENIYKKIDNVNETILKDFKYYLYNIDFITLSKPYFDNIVKNEDNQTRTRPHAGGGGNIYEDINNKDEKILLKKNKKSKKCKKICKNNKTKIMG